MYPLEYEDLRIHKGKLNELYDIHQRGINRAVKQFSAAKMLLQHCNEHNGVLDDVAKSLGRELKDALDKRVSSIAQLTTDSDFFYTNDRNAKNIFTPNFWNQFFSLRPEDCLYIGQSHLNGGAGVRLSKKEFLDLLNVGIPDIGIREVLNVGLNNIANINLDKKIESVRISDFYSNPDLSCPINNVEEDCVESFSSIVKQIMGDGLVSELILEGFIRKDFDLYISKYPSDAKPRVVNFVYHCYQRGVQNLDYVLDNDDCQAVLNIIPTTHLGKSCCFNRYLFVYVLSRKVVEPSIKTQDAITTMVDGIIDDFPGSGKQLIERLFEGYPNNRSLVQTLITTLLAQTERAFDILVDSSKDTCSLQTQHELMSYALANMNPETAYTCKSSSSWLSYNIELMSIARIAVNQSRATKIANYLKRCAITIHDLSSLGEQLGMSVVDLGNFDVTRSNLLFACKTIQMPTLDTLDEVYPVVYEKVISSEEALASYLNAMGPTEYTATQFAPFVFNGLCRGVELWENSAYVDNLAGTIIERVNPDAKAVNLDAFCPLDSIDDLNVMGRALIRELILNNKAAKTYRNAVYILKLEDVDSDCRGHKLFDVFMGRGSIGEMLNNLTSGTSNVGEFANGLLYRTCLTPEELLNVMLRLKEIEEDSFPITVVSDTIGEINYDKPTVVTLADHGLIGPLKVVYEYLDGGYWNFRKKILKKLLRVNPPKEWSVLPRLFACDLARIVAAAKSWGSWLAEDIVADAHYYIDQCCEDNSEKERVLMEIRKKAEEKGLL